MKLNENFNALEESYLFSAISRKVSAFCKTHPDAPILRLGIGDVTLPLCPAIAEQIKQALCQMQEQTSFRGYGPEQGYPFLKEAIQSAYLNRGISLEQDEIFISDGAKSDLANLLDLFDKDNTVFIPDPVYPVYVDTNLMAGRRIAFVNATIENGFLPLPDRTVRADIIYLCSPNNPTGAVYDRAGLTAWVKYALEQNAVLLFDAAYEAFISSPELPRSIFEIDGAKECAIEICSFSKTAGFTGLRCGYTVVPHALVRSGMHLNKMWLRRQTTKFNSVSYIVQCGAAAVFTPEGQKQIQASLNYYLENAKAMAQTLKTLKIPFTGGLHSPYLWLQCPDGMDSWSFFDYLLEKAHIVGTPGAGFGKNGANFFRLTAFSSKENTLEAMDRIRNLFA